MTQPKVAVVGGGLFGWGLALAAERAGREVLLWSRRPQREATAGIRLVPSLAELAAAELVFFAVPSPVMPAVAGELGEHLSGAHYLVHVSRGIVGESLMTLSQVLRTRTPSRRVGALVGPLVAQALIDGAPGGGLVASRFPEVKTAVREALGGTHLRIYGTDDLVGAEFAATAVGLLAMAVGFAREVGLGPATLAVMVSRGMTECTRIGVHLGGRAETFAGLAGYGDLLAAVAGDERPELTVGAELAARAAEDGRAAGPGGSEAAGPGGPGTAGPGDLQAPGGPAGPGGKHGGAFIEGLASARRIAAYAQRNGLHAPLISLCADVFERRISGPDAIRALMARQVGEE